MRDSVDRRSVIGTASAALALVLGAATRAEGFDNLAEPSVRDSAGTMKALIERDFLRLDIVVVEGWVLSRTEFGLCGPGFQR